MSDYFGTQQPRVLTTQDRNLDNVVFQYRKPPLTSEWNLINQISNEKIQEISKASYPSGWMTVGDILQDWTESDVMTGQVNCSATYEANSFKLFSKGDNVAVVNGWPIKIQGTESPDSNNNIRLGAPAGQFYDFVFLEVWRKLVGTNDYIYPYGNVLSTPYTDNEIEWSTIGTETTKRVQIQYRIRVVDINSMPDPTSDGFDSTIYPIGGRTAGEYQYASYAFTKYGASDIGLYVSGDGSEESQTILGTVDGYVYAIPMFMVSRRTKWDTIFTASTMRRAFVGKEDQALGYVLDRPDGALADVVYKDDIVDFRHQILSSGKDVETLLEQTVSKLIAGELTTAVKTGFGAAGATTSSSVGGGTLTKVECLNTSGSIPSIGTGSGTLATDFKRRSFCNAEYTHDHNVLEIPHTGLWAIGDTFDPSILLTLPAGSIVTVDGFYNATVGSVTNITPTLPVASTLFTVGAGSNLIGQSSLLMEFTFKYDSSDSGFKDVPREFLEAGKGTYLPIATRDEDVSIRYNNAGYLLNFGINPGPNQPDDYTDARDFLRYKGGNYTENSEFGHEMVVHRTTNSSGISVLTLSDGKYNGYYVLGVKSVEIEASGVFGVPTSFSVKRDIAVASPYNTVSYTVQTLSVSAINNIRITLYIGSKPPVSGVYSVADSLKFFELSKQGRGILDTYEVIEVIGVEDGSGTFWVDTIDKPIISLLTQAVWSAGYVEGQAFAWKVDSTSSDTSMVITAPTNQDLPLLDSSSYTADMTPTRIKVTVAAAAGQGTIRVPVLVHSYVTESETPYNFFYKTNAYQGLLNRSTVYYGKLVNEGPALVTTMGSGAVTNTIYANEPFLVSTPFVGMATFTPGSRTVTGSVDSGDNLPQWLAYARSGDYIREAGSSQYYRILSVSTDIALILSETFVGTGGVPVDYDIIRLDMSHDNISNVVDRLPALKITALSSGDLVDYKCYSDNMISGSILFHGLSMTEPRQKMQDPMNALTNDFVIGTDSTSKRGRNNFLLTMGKNTTYKLSDTPRPQIIYEASGVFDPVHPFGVGHAVKVYQAYLFNMSAKGQITGESDLTGRLYLMVVSGETKSINPFETSLNGFFDRDAVDIYELVGRPIVKL